MERQTTLKYQRVVADASDDGQRADVVVGRHLATVSRRVAKSMARRGKLYRDDRPIAASTRVRSGDRLELRWEAGATLPPVVVLGMSDAYVYVNKPAGVHTHRLRPDDPPALADAVAQVHAECADASDDPREGGAVHRLDQGTSGVVAFARSRHAWRRAREHINSPEVEKLYLARSVPPQVSLPNLVSWPPPSTWAHPDPTPLPHLPAWLSARVPRAANPATVVRAPLASQGPRVVVRVDARGATSVVWPLAQANDGAWLLLVALRSGARHQARVHLATLGLPVVGDPLYGPHTGPWADRSAHSERLYLHALVLDLGRAEHTPMRVEAPVEDSFVGTLTGVRPWEAPGSRGA